MKARLHLFLSILLTFALVLPTQVLAGNRRSLCEPTASTIDANRVLTGQGASNVSELNPHLYTGEQFDPDLGFYYLRARYNNPDSGRFWTMDDYEGNGSDPMALHKYLYCHANPINGFDPSGRFLSLNEAQLAKCIAITLVVGGVGGIAIWAAWEPIQLWRYSRPATTAEKDYAIQGLTTIQQYWKANDKIDQLISDLKSGTFKLAYYKTDGFGGRHAKLGGDTGYVYRYEFNEKDGGIALALSLFGEYQHFRFSEEFPDKLKDEDGTAQAEFNLVRDSIPQSLRTTHVDSLKHGD